MNKLYCGDNLKIMEGMADASIDLICTDPPFCSGRDYGAFNDKWDDGLKGYLKFMRPRVEQMHRLLKDTGSLYLHCDPSASHYLKVMLDKVFGRKQFRNEIVWHYSKWTNNSNKFQSGHGNIYFYASSDQYIFNKLYTTTEYQQYLYDVGYKNNTIMSKGVRVKQLIVYDSSKAKKEIQKNNYDKLVYCTDKKGSQMSDSWTDIQYLNSCAKERTGYPTQKPIALYQRMIQASSNEGHVVLDPFCGSGTTLVAANNLGRQYIGIDENPDAIRIAEERLAQLNLFIGVENPQREG